MEKIAEINYYETEENKKYEDLINQVLTTCFKEEKMDKLGLYVSITLTCPSYIKKINNEYRNIVQVRKFVVIVDIKIKK